VQIIRANTASDRIGVTLVKLRTAFGSTTPNVLAVPAAATLGISSGNMRGPFAL